MKGSWYDFHTWRCKKPKDGVFWGLEIRGEKWIHSDIHTRWVPDPVQNGVKQPLLSRVKEPQLPIYFRPYRGYNSFISGRGPTLYKSVEIVAMHLLYIPIKRKPANFLETVGLECAIWPHLYWRRDMCETYVRSQGCGALRMCIAGLSGSLTRLSFLIGRNCSLALKGIGYFDLAKT